MNYKDKLCIVIICNDLYKKIKKIENLLKADNNNNIEIIDEEEIQKFSEEEIKEKINETTLSLKKSLLTTEFSTSFNYGANCLISSVFIVKNIPLFKKYTSEHIQNIDINKSNYFWDNLSISFIEFGDPEYSLLDIYNVYKTYCDELNIDGLYDMIEELIDTICFKYNEYMELKGNGLNIKDELDKKNTEIVEKENEEKRMIQEESQEMYIKNIVVPAILLVPFATLMFTHFNFIYFVVTIILFIWLCVGMSSKSNSCKKCGKWNSYVLIDEEVLDSYVTTENKTEYRNGQPYTYHATVTKEKILQTFECKNCGDVKYIKTERNK